MKLLLSPILISLFSLSIYAMPARSNVKMVAYISDLEGQWEKWQSFVNHHPAFENGSDGLRHLRADSAFVFGGDVPDRGNGTLRITKELLRLKKQAPDRVFFIAGNRDINKTRLGVELSATPIEARTEQLKGILEKTMGSPKAFEYRREELSLLAGGKSISDDAVVESFLDETSPTGPFGQLLASSSLALRLGSTLFVHSGIPESALGFVPGQSDRHSSTDIWIAELNKWFSDHIADWQRNPIQAATSGSLKQLNDYARPEKDSKTNRFSIVYGITVGGFNNPFLPSKIVMDALAKDGINQLVVGHTPMGQTPVVLKSNSGFQMLYADTSYSLLEKSAPIIILSGNKFNNLQVSFDAPVEFGIKTKLTTKAHASSLPQAIGQRNSSEELIIARVPEDNFLTVRLADGRRTIYRTISKTELGNLHEPLPTTSCENLWAQ